MAAEERIRVQRPREANKSGVLRVISPWLAKQKPLVRVVILLLLAGFTCTAATVTVRTLRGGNLRNLLASFFSLLLGTSSQDGQRNRVSRFSDPTFGDEYNVSYSRSKLQLAWEPLMDGLGLNPDSPIRGHIHQLFAKPSLDKELKKLFDVLGSGGADRLDVRDVGRFSAGIKGHIHVLLQSRSKVPLMEATSEDTKWLADNFDSIFPEDQPLDRPTFPAVAKLILLRRILLTLISNLGLERVKGGMNHPLVVQIRVELANRQPFRLHTVAPSSVKSTVSGESLGSLTESEQESDFDSEVPSAAPSPSAIVRSWDE